MVSWLWTLDVVDNGITSLGECCDGQDPILSLAQRSCSSYAKAFLMSSIFSLDHEIVQLPDTVGMLWVYQTSQRNWVAIKVHYRYLRKCLLGWHESRLGFVTPCKRRGISGPTCWKYALEAIIKVLLLYFLVHDNCLLFML